MTEKKVGFWRWYLGLPVLGIALGAVIIGVGSTMLGSLLSPLWLLVTIPVGATMFVHVHFRMSRGE